MKIRSSGFAVGLSVVASSLTLIQSPAALASGYEKAVMWSGKNAGMASAGAASVEGAESLYFNPAGLAAGHENFNTDVSGNFSPTWIRVSGPLVQSYTKSDTNWQFVPVFGAVASRKLTDRLGVGLGVYVSGGNQAVYDSVDFASWNSNFTNAKTTVKAELKVTEASLGAGYELLPGLRIGAAWRAVMAKANFSTPIVSSTQLISLSLDNMKDTNLLGARLGAQYEPESKRWGVGAQWRSETAFHLEGTSSGRYTFNSNVVNQAITGGSAYAENKFPQQLQVGGFYEPIAHDLRLHAQVDWAQYSVNQRLHLGGEWVTLPTPLGNVKSSLSDIQQNWQDLYNLRFGVEYAGCEDWVFRGGYIRTSQVTPNEFARALFSSPGYGNTFTLGVSRDLMNHQMTASLAGEYGSASGEVRTANLPNLNGDYSSKAMAVHSGLTYRF